MDPFVLAVLVFTGICVVAFIFSIKSKTLGRTSSKVNTREDKNLKYLEEIKRYEFWRDNDKQRSD